MQECEQRVQIVAHRGQYFILIPDAQSATQVDVFEVNAVKGELYKDILEKKQRVAMDGYLSKLIADAQIANFLSPKKSKVGKMDTQAAMDLQNQDKLKR